jgi:hypothetical protein
VTDLTNTAHVIGFVIGAYWPAIVGGAFIAVSIIGIIALLVTASKVHG